MIAPELSPEEAIRVAAFGLDRPELDLDAIEARAAAVEPDPVIVEPWTAAADGMTQECREGQHHACVGDPWRVTGDNPLGCTCSHHAESEPIDTRIPEEGP